MPWRVQESDGGARVGERDLKRAYVLRDAPELPRCHCSLAQSVQQTGLHRGACTK